MALIGLIGLTSADSLRPRHPAARKLASRSLDARQSTPTHTAYYFDQLIDHFPNEARYAPHDNGTYKQRYYVETSYYKPGGPVFLYLAGEGPIDGDTHLDSSLITHLMQQFNGIGVVLENRYYGTSNPYNTSTTDELRYQTTEQVIADFDLFARKVQLPGANFTNVNAPATPWITYGGSYPGALSAFTVKTYGQTFYAGISSSGVIHGQVEYPEWYNPIQLLAPQDCVASINNIVDKMDSLVQSNNSVAIRQLKQIFGLTTLTDIRDFAQTIAFPIGGPFVYPTYTWQEVNWNPAFAHIDFFDFCRNVTDVNAPANNTAVDTQLAQYTNGENWKNLGNYAAYIKRVVLPTCATGDYNSAECFGTQHPDYWANTTNNYVRSYLYTTCTEFGAYQAAQPYGQKSLISRVIDANYTQQWCNWAFPAGTYTLHTFLLRNTYLEIGKYNTIPPTPDLERWNVYGDLNFTADRLLFVDGSADPWRNLCYHSTSAPQRYWTDEHPEHLINGAGHVWDLRALANISAEPQFIRETTYLELRTVETWLKDFAANPNYS
ncbi:MAG: hypothetical protein M1821_000553 [Bathelium mastoideum]|nr:MAG: hypothetical protein M1821_000553 [Bathelium mastoideum]